MQKNILSIKTGFLISIAKSLFFQGTLTLIRVTKPKNKNRYLSKSIILINSSKVTIEHEVVGFICACLFF